MNTNKTDLLNLVIQIKERILDSVFGYFIPTRENRHYWRQLFITTLKPLSTPLSHWIDKKIDDDTISVANIITALRIPAGIIFVIFYDYTVGNTSYVINLIFVAITDLIDGWLARRMNQVTIFGKKFDAGCDKFYAACVVIALWSKFYWWSIYPLIILDVVLLVGAKNGEKLKKYFPNLEIGSNKFGRWKFTVQGIGALIILCNEIPIGNYTLVLANILAFGSIYRHLYPKKSSD